MPDQSLAADGYALQLSDAAVASKKDLPPDAALALFDVMVTLAARAVQFSMVT